MTDESSPEPVARPVLRVVKGDPSAEELAALLGVLLSRAPAEARRAPVRAWASQEIRLRRQLAAGPGTWRRSSWI